MADWRQRFTRRFEELKRDQGLTQMKLAAEIGFSQSAISAWLNGSRSPDRLEDYEALAAGLRMHPAELIYGIDVDAYRTQADMLRLSPQQLAAVREHVRAYLSTPPSSDSHSEADAASGG